MDALYLSVLMQLLTLHPSALWIKILLEGIEEDPSIFKEGMVRIDRFIGMWGREVALIRESSSPDGIPQKMVRGVWIEVYAKPLGVELSMRYYSDEFRFLGFNPPLMETASDPDFPKKFKSREKAWKAYLYAKGPQHCTHLVKQHLLGKAVPELVKLVVDIQQLYHTLEPVYPFITELR